MSEAEGSHVVDHRPLYYKIFGVLMALTLITVAVSKIPGMEHHHAAGIIIAMAIASVKATLVALFFMHLKFEVKSIYIIVGVPLLLTAILIMGLMPDIARLGQH